MPDVNQPLESDVGRSTAGVRRIDDHRVLPAHHGELMDLRAVHRKACPRGAATPRSASSK
jgi:hypothetical protein